ncbi:MAG: hypothetical protein P4L38_08920, partial [Syntrophaceae bacterium]|nr:hypothetical protein [Syntrophaceae bacterium]
NGKLFENSNCLGNLSDTAWLAVIKSCSVERKLGRLLRRHWESGSRTYTSRVFISEYVFF